MPDSLGQDESPVLLGYQFIIAETLIRRIAPILGADFGMHVFSAGFGETVGQRLQQNRAVIIVLCFETLHVLVKTDARRYRKCAEIVINTGIGRSHKIRQTEMRLTFGLTLLLPQMMQLHLHRVT